MTKNELSQRCTGCVTSEFRFCTRRKYILEKTHKPFIIQYYFIAYYSHRLGGKPIFHISLISNNTPLSPNIKKTKIPRRKREMDIENFLKCLSYLIFTG